MTEVEARSRHHLRTARDPVCGMTVDPATATQHVQHDGHRYVFCSARCRQDFIAEPSRYSIAPPPPRAAGEALWTCPMHPQIVRNAPGHCPICGMALEPMTPAPGETGNPELRDMTRRFRADVALSLPLLAIAMAQHFDKPALDTLIPPRLLVWLQLVLGTPAVIWEAGRSSSAAGPRS